MPEAREAALRRDLQIGLEQLDRGECVDGEEAFRKVLDRLDELGDGES